MPYFLIDAGLGDRVGVQTEIALAISVIDLTVPVLSHLQLVYLHLHLPILLDQLLHVSNRNRCFLQLFILLLKLHEFGVDIVRTHALPLHVQQLLQVLDLLLQFTHDFHVLAVKLHRFHFHHDLTRNGGTCLARSTNLRVFMVSSMLLRDGEILPTMKVKVLPVRES